jgi:hypothetical protein
MFNSTFISTSCIQQNPHVRFVCEIYFLHFNLSKVIDRDCAKLTGDYYCGYKTSIFTLNLHLIGFFNPFDISFVGYKQKLKLGFHCTRYSDSTRVTVVYDYVPSIIHDHKIF